MTTHSNSSKTRRSYLHQKSTNLSSLTKYMNVNNQSPRGIMASSPPWNLMDNGLLTTSFELILFHWLEGKYFISRFFGNMMASGKGASTRQVIPRSCHTCHETYSGYTTTRLYNRLIFRRCKWYSAKIKSHSKANDFRKMSE